MCIRPWMCVSRIGCSPLAGVATASHSLLTPTHPVDLTEHGDKLSNHADLRLDPGRSREEPVHHPHLREGPGTITKVLISLKTKFKGRNATCITPQRHFKPQNRTATTPFHPRLSRCLLFLRQPHPRTVCRPAIGRFYPVIAAHVLEPPPPPQPQTVLGGPRWTPDPPRCTGTPPRPQARCNTTTTRHDRRGGPNKKKYIYSDNIQPSNQAFASAT